MYALFAAVPGGLTMREGMFIAEELALTGSLDIHSVAYGCFHVSFPQIYSTLLWYTDV